MDLSGVLQLTFLITSRALPLVALDRLRVLPLASLTRLLLSVLDDAFQSGTFLRGLIAGTFSAAITVSDALISAQVYILRVIGSQHTSPGVANVQSLSKSLLLANMASLSGMYSQLLSVLADYRPVEAWPVMQDTTDMFVKITRNVESDWLKTPFAHAADEDLGNVPAPCFSIHPMI